MLLTAIPAVIIGALVSKYIPAKIYKWLIGIVLIVLGIIRKKRKPQKQLRKRSLPDFQATATSTYVLVFMTITGAIFHIADGRVDWSADLPLMIGAILGAIIAPRLAQISAKTKITRYMKPTIGILLILLGAKSLL